MELLNFWDWCVIGCYFAVLAAVIYFAGRKQSDMKDYFLGGRNIGFFAIGASLFASNVGSEHIVGLAGSGAASGMAMAHWELQAWFLVLLGWAFVPFYYRSGVFTMPEFLERRFDARARWILSVVSLIAYIFTKVSVTVYAGALVFQTLLPTTFGSPENAFWIGAFATVALTGIYTVFGGLRAVLYTDAAQAVVLIAGSCFITFFGLRQLGGFGELQEFCRVNAAQHALWRPNSDSLYPWLGVMIASPIIGFWYWCTDQYIVQRTLAARNLATARRGAIFGGFLKLFPVFIFLVPGMIGAALHYKGFLQLPLRSGGGIDGDSVFPAMVTGLLPSGLRGLVVGGLLAALMSSLSSLFNSSASLFTVDIYEKLRPNASQKEYVNVGRLATAAVVLLGILWIPVMKLVSGGGLYTYLQSVQGFIAPPIAAVFLLGIFWPRINGRGAVWGMGAGFVLGMTKLTCQTFFGAGKLDVPLLSQLGDLNAFYATGWLFLLSLLITTAASLTAPAQPAADIAGVTYATIDRAEVRASYGMADYLGSALVLGFVVLIYLYFSFWI